jgi:hypothetical protein
MSWLPVVGSYFKKSEPVSSEITIQERNKLREFYDALSKPFLGKDGIVQYSYQLDMTKFKSATLSNIVDGITDFQKRPMTLNRLNELDRDNPSISITRTPAPNANIPSDDAVNHFVSILTELKQFIIADLTNKIFNESKVYDTPLGTLLPTPISRAPITPRGRGGRRTKRSKRSKRTRRHKY